MHTAAIARKVLSPLAPRPIGSSSSSNRSRSSVGAAARVGVRVGVGVGVGVGAGARAGAGVGVGVGRRRRRRLLLLPLPHLCGYCCWCWHCRVKFAVSSAQAKGFYLQSCPGCRQAGSRGDCTTLLPELCSARSQMYVAVMNTCLYDIRTSTCFYGPALLQRIHWTAQ